MQILITCEIFRGNVKTDPLSYRLLAVLGSGKGGYGGKYGGEVKIGSECKAGGMVVKKG